MTRNNGDSDDSESPPPRSKRRPSHRSQLPSESPPQPSRSPPKRTRIDEQYKSSERETDKFRDSENSKRKEGRNERVGSKEMELDGGKDRDMERQRRREREREIERETPKESLGEKETERQRPKEREKERERERERDKERYRDRHRDRSREKAVENMESGRKERRRDKESDRERQGNAGSRKDRDQEQNLEHNKGREKERDGVRKEKRRSYSRSPNRVTHARDEVSDDQGEDVRSDDVDDSLAKMKAAEAAIEEKQKEKEKPSFEYSGKLAAETNKVRGVTLLFTEPPEARKPTTRWRLYIFKQGEPLNEPLYIHRLSCYLFGRERRVADVPTDHPSCSKQHAVIQYRLVEKEEEDGSVKSEVKPYVMDLGSTNGTFLNGERIESQRYYELIEKDTLKFGNSSREYVLLHENSKA